MSDIRTAVSDFLMQLWGKSEPLSDDADILHNLGIDGDDAFEFIERFAAKFETTSPTIAGISIRSGSIPPHRLVF